MGNKMIIVLDQGFVKLLDVYGSDLTVVNAARVSFGKQKAELDSKDEELISYLVQHNHLSPFRHCSLRFHIKMPIFVMRQFVKHRVGCEINEISGRYVEFKQNDYYSPLSFRVQSKNNKQGSGDNITQGQNIRALVQYERSCQAAFETYVKLLNMGIAKEMARMCLPLSLYTEIHATMSLEAVSHFIKLRKDPHAQYEIRQYSNAIEQLFLQSFPISAKALLGDSRERAATN